MLKKERNKGITLIALIITIIVLLILAGVTISAITGNESVMEKAKEAKEKQEASTELEQFQLAYISAVADLEKTNITAQELEDYLNNNMNMNVLVGEVNYYHDKVSDKFWRYRSYISTTDIQNVEHFKGNENVNLESGTYKVISNMDNNNFYIIDNGVIKPFSSLSRCTKLETGTLQSGNLFINIRSDSTIPKGYSCYDWGIIMTHNASAGESNAEAKLDYNLIKDILQFKDNSFDNVNDKAWKVPNDITYNGVYNTQGIGHNSTWYLYSRSYIILQKDGTDEKIILYDEPISVTYNQIQALQQGN